MLRLTILCIGRTTEAWVREGTGKYLLLLGKYCRTEWIELPDVKNASKLEPPALREAEEELIMKHLPERAYPVFLDENGKDFDSREFAEFIQRSGDRNSHLVFVIGGAYGISKNLLKKGESVSLSKMTFTHQMVRVILCEQIFRAFTILKGTGYHH